MKSLNDNWSERVVKVLDDLLDKVIIRLTGKAFFSKYRIIATYVYDGS